MSVLSLATACYLQFALAETANYYGADICDGGLRALATGGILMKSFSRSMDAFITYGVQLIRTVWTSWSKAKETRKLPRSFSASY
jgi:hypothetical protein